jgi:hypothetical protein
MLEGVLGSRSGFYGLPCGEGKSLSWLVPTVISSVSGARRSMRIVVLPYNFLVGHMVQDTINKVGRRLLRPNDAASVTRSTYNRRGALDFLSVRSPFDDNLPSLVFIALDAFALLLKEHSGPLKLMGKLGLIAAYYIDEIQQAVMESSFRDSYACLKDLARYGRPIFLLSGSLPLPMATNMMTFLGIPDGDVVTGGSPVSGDGISYTCRVFTAGQDPDLHVAGMVTQKATRDEVACHVICASKHAVGSLNALLAGKGLRVLMAHSDVDDTADVARKWSAGEGDVLLSTTCALTGCEYDRCKHVIIFGVIYSVSNMVQAIGRLRKKQRADGASVTVVYDGGLRAPQGASYDQFQGAGFVTEDCRDVFESVFHEDGLRGVLSGREENHLSSLSYCVMNGTLPPACRVHKTLHAPADGQHKLEHERRCCTSVERVAVVKRSTARSTARSPATALASVLETAGTPVRKEGRGPRTKKPRRESVSPESQSRQDMADSVCLSELLKVLETDPQARKSTGPGTATKQRHHANALGAVARQGLLKPVALKSTMGSLDNAARAQVSHEKTRIQARSADATIAWLKSRCPEPNCQNPVGCAGDCTGNVCYTCGLKGHLVKDCKADLSKVGQNKMCYLCYDSCGWGAVGSNGRTGHGKGICQLQRRLKRLFQLMYQVECTLGQSSKGFAAYLARVHGSDKTFVDFLIRAYDCCGT